MVIGIDVLSKPSPKMRSLSWLRPKGHFDHVAWELVRFIALGVALAVATTVAVAWAAGFGNVMHRLAHPNLIWIPLALPVRSLPTSATCSPTGRWERPAQ
jgi:hypothetical protein